MAAACAEEGRGVLYALLPALGGSDEDAVERPPPDDSRDGEVRDTPDLGEEGDPLTGGERFGVPPQASGTGVEVYVARFGAARCGDDLCLGVRLSEAPQGRLHVMISFKPEGRAGEAGRITVPTDGNGQVDVGHGRPLDAAVSARWEGPELRVRVPLSDLHPVHGGASFVVASPKLESVAGPALRYPESSPLGFRVDPR